MITILMSFIFYMGIMNTGNSKGVLAGSFCDGKKNDLYPDPKNCGYYIDCNKHVRQRCAPGTFFNDKTKECDFPENVQRCEHQLYSETGDNYNLAGVVEQFDVIDIDRNLQMQKDLSGVEKSKAFRQQNKDMNANVLIGDGTNDGNHDPFCIGKTEGNYPDPDFCDYFYQCSLSFSVRQRCAPSTVFNPVKATCDHPHEVPRCESYFEKKDESYSSASLRNGKDMYSSGNQNNKRIFQNEEPARKSYSLAEYIGISAKRTRKNSPIKIFDMGNENERLPLNLMNNLQKAESSTTANTAKYIVSTEPIINNDKVRNKNNAQLQNESRKTLSIPTQLPEKSMALTNSENKPVNIDTLNTTPENSVAKSNALLDNLIPSIKRQTYLSVKPGYNMKTSSLRHLLKMSAVFGRPVIKEKKPRKNVEKKSAVVEEKAPLLKENTKYAFREEKQEHVIQGQQQNIITEKKPKSIENKKPTIKEEKAKNVLEEKRHRITEEKKLEQREEKEHRSLNKKKPTITKDKKHTLRKVKQALVIEKPKLTGEKKPRITIEKEPKFAVEKKPKDKQEKKTSAFKEKKEASTGKMNYFKKEEKKLNLRQEENKSLINNNNLVSKNEKRTKKANLTESSRKEDINKQGIKVHSLKDSKVPKHILPVGNIRIEDGIQKEENATRLHNSQDRNKKNPLNNTSKSKGNKKFSPIDTFQVFVNSKGEVKQLPLVQSQSGRDNSQNVFHNTLMKGPPLPPLSNKQLHAMIEAKIKMLKRLSTFISSDKLNAILRRALQSKDNIKHRKDVTKHTESKSSTIVTQPRLIVVTSMGAGVKRIKNIVKLRNGYFVPASSLTDGSHHSVTNNVIPSDIKPLQQVRAHEI